MKKFTELFLELDASNRSSHKLAALRRYFERTAPGDAAWAVFFLMGKRLKRPLGSREFREWAGTACGFPEWIVEECYGHVGDLAETLALLLAHRPKVGLGAAVPSLQELVERIILPMKAMEPEERRRAVVGVWSKLDGPSCFVFNKLITGGFRVGVSQGLVSKALAEVIGVEPAVIAHRLTGTWQPTEAGFLRLREAVSDFKDPAQPYPFCLAHPLDGDFEAMLEEKLGPCQDWQIEWKWDGMRAQVIKRGAEVIIWSRGEEMVAEQFPELVEAAAHWSDAVVLDGEILVWREGDTLPQPFAVLQKRLGRKKVSAALRAEAPVVFMAYDLLERKGLDLRGKSTVERRAGLEQFHRDEGGLAESGGVKLFYLSPLLRVESWVEVGAARAQSRERGVEGLMLKRSVASYSAGRKRGDWWKWKVKPYTVDAVMVYAQQGHGRRAGLFTDYTFSVWNGAVLVPFAKAYSGLSDAELRRVDRWVRAHTREKHGPVRVVDPELVFEIAFEGIAESKRHKSGIAVRFPRIHRWREDKSAQEADTIETVRALLPSSDLGI